LVFVCSLSTGEDSIGLKGETFINFLNLLWGCERGVLVSDFSETEDDDGADPSVTWFLDSLK